mgnify:CR=1 FL=1
MTRRFGLLSGIGMAGLGVAGLAGGGLLWTFQGKTYGLKLSSLSPESQSLARALALKIAKEGKMAGVRTEWHRNGNKKLEITIVIFNSYIY